MVPEKEDLENWLNLPSQNIEESSDPIISCILEAVREKKKIRISYVKGSDPGMFREITPEKVFSRYDFSYVDAYCHTRGAKRCFRVDRIRIPGITKKRATRKYGISNESRKYVDSSAPIRMPSVRSVSSSDSKVPKTSYSSASSGSGCLVTFIMIPLVYIILELVDRFLLVS